MSVQRKMLYSLVGHVAVFDSKDDKWKMDSNPDNMTFIATTNNQQVAERALDDFRVARHEIHTIVRQGLPFLPIAESEQIEAIDKLSNLVDMKE